MMKKILLSILFIILLAGTIIGIHSVLNGGIGEWSTDINNMGFFKAVGKFFSEIWYGFKSAIGK